MTEAGVLQTTQIGAESTSGVAVPALKRMRAMSIAANFGDVDIEEFRPEGFNVNTFTIYNRERVAAALSGKPTYTEFVYPLSGLWGAANISTPGGATNARDWVFTPPSFAGSSAVTFTVEKKGVNRSYRFAYGLVNQLGYTITRSPDSNSIDMSGNMLGKRIEDGIQPSTNEVQTLTVGGATSGDFTLTYDSQTTSAINYDAAASAVQSALEALSNIAVGDVVCAGGPLDSADVTIEFRGNLAQTDVDLITATDSTSGGTGADVTLTTAGVAPTDIPIIPMIPLQFDLYIDDASGDLGTTQITDAFTIQWNAGPKYMLKEAIDSSEQSFSSHYDIETPSTMQIRFERSAAASAYLAAMRSGTTKFIRVEANGAADSIESGFGYRFRHDFAGQIVQPDLSEQSRLSTLQWTFTNVYDATWAKKQEMTLRNALTSL